MTQDTTTSLHELAGIDLDFRPDSYFWPMGAETHLLARMKGAERKAALQRHITAGRRDAIPDILARSKLEEEERRAIGRIHPRFLGGEFLPDLGKNEVTIARITIQSTTQDVTCVLARRCRHRIHYRVVDEYDGDTLSETSTRTSSQPLTLGALEAFFNGAWSLFDCLEWNFRDEGYPFANMVNFFAVDSQFYPDISMLYLTRFIEWSCRFDDRNEVQDECV